MMAMGVERFIVTLRHAKEPKQEERHWHRDEVIYGTAWLKRMNARGYDVLIKPDGGHGLILLDGLSSENIRALQDAGFAPALVAASGADSCQEWVKLSEGQLPDKDRSSVAIDLIQKVLRNKTHVINREDGLLAGFTNHQLFLRDGRHPYVKIMAAEGKLATSAEAYLSRLRGVSERSHSRQIGEGHGRSR